jgi:TRAP transporter TAXI family solute receptor
MGDSAQLLDVTDEQLAAINADAAIWERAPIAAGTYPGQDSAVASIAQRNFLVVRADVDEEAVYQVTRTLFENLGFLGAIHGAMREVSLETDTRGLTLPLHPGAARYFREIGILPPYDAVSRYDR